MVLTRNGVDAPTPYTFAPDNSGKANAIAGIYEALPDVSRFLIGALIVTLNPTRLYVAIDTTGNKIADTWEPIVTTLMANAKPGDDDGS